MRYRPPPIKIIDADYDDVPPRRFFDVRCFFSAIFHTLMMLMPKCRLIITTFSWLWAMLRCRRFSIRRFDDFRLFSPTLMIPMPNIISPTLKYLLREIIVMNIFHYFADITLRHFCRWHFHFRQPLFSMMYFSMPTLIIITCRRWGLCISRCIRVIVADVRCRAIDVMADVDDVAEMITLRCDDAIDDD